MNILARDIVVNIGESRNFVAMVLSNNGVPDKNVRVNLVLKNSAGNSNLYELTSDNEGLVKLPINLAFPGEYAITTYYKSDEFTTKLTVIN